MLRLWYFGAVILNYALSGGKPILLFLACFFAFYFFSPRLFKNTTNKPRQVLGISSTSIRKFLREKISSLYFIKIHSASILKM